jgi:G:T-mismatch repair DNA endonuclease (very short patch repair protein)
MASVKQAWIKKYGEVEGLRKWEDQKKRFNSNGTPPINNNRIEYWLALGYTEEESKLQVSISQRERNKFCDEYYAKRNISDPVEILKIQEASKLKSKKGSKRSIDYYLNNGLSHEEASNKLKEYQSIASAKSKKFLGHSHTKEAKIKQSNATRRNKLNEIALIGKEAWLDKNFGDRHNNTGCISKLERLIQENIKSLCKDKVFKFNKKISNTSYIVDIQVDNKVIEVNGDYWHCNPKIYKSGDYIKKPGGMYLVDDQWTKDASRCKDLEALNYSIFIIWESDWKSKKDIILDQVIKFIYEIN